RLLSPDVVERGAVLAGLDGDRELGERLGERVDLVVVGAVGERGCLFDQPADPRGTGGQVHVAGGDQRGDGGGAGFLPALGVDRDQAGHPVPQRVDYRRPVRLVFDVFRGRLRPACGQVDYLVAGLGESPAAADLV